MKGFALLGVCSLVVGATAVQAADFEGVLKSRIIRVGTSRLVTMLGRDATDASKVFAVPVERFASQTEPDSGVQVKEADLKVKGSKVRLDDAANGIYIIIDTESGLMSIVKPKDKAYLEWTKNDRQRMNAANESVEKSMHDQAAKKADGKEAGAPAEAKALNKSETINDMKASAYEVRSGDTTALGWVSAEYKDVARVYKAFQSGDMRLNNAPSAESGIERAFAAKGLPVRVQILDSSGYQIRELKGVEAKSLDKGLFAPPSDYTKQTMDPKAAASQ